ncbi:SPOR domain-containing protein [Pseudoxanthomonas sp. 22568]|uniref:SPOR domain-containing protein n=1 Tax=Pseudoxanthomonas sp. 22568 TaxID=3453945 RepID=UPI003F84EDFE
MLIRALIVLLAVLNLGVAAWWLTRPEPAASPLPEVPAGVTRLELVESTVPSSAAPQAAVTATTPPSSPAAPAAPPTAARACFRAGPFAERAAADLARGRIDPTVGRAIPREMPGKGASGYRVSLPPMASREEAVAMAQRIGAAGFDDFLVINQGEETNGIALGRYRSREGAGRRQAQLAAAGFPARVHAIGEEGPSRWWLDVAAPAGTTAMALRPLAGVPVQPQDCPAALR